VAVSPAGRARYWEVTVPVPAEIAEGVTNFLWELGALGVVEEEEPAGERPHARAFFPDTFEAGELHARVEEYLASFEPLGLARAGSPRVALLVDAGWAEAWREHFRPIAVGRRLLVAPPWEAPPPGSHDAGMHDRAAGPHAGWTAGERLPVVIDPGRAFGTGHHATTAGCLEALETIVEAGSPEQVLDIGTGSGILGIAAARLGAPAVLAIDSDPDAVAATEQNAALNGVTARVRVQIADADTVDVAPSPLVLANLLAAAHVALAARYARLVAPGGHLVLGGILDGEAAAVEDAVRGHGFARVSAAAVEGWTTLVLRRPGGDGRGAG
jgi:ribosomal protein L11 methyltransferase